MTHPWTDHMNAHPFTHDEPLTVNTVNPAGQIHEHRIRSIVRDEMERAAEKEQLLGEISTLKAQIIFRHVKVGYLESVLEFHAEKGEQMPEDLLRHWLRDFASIDPRKSE